MKSSKLPIQAAPVERTIVGTPMSSGNGVDPSFDWGGLVKTIGSVAAPLLGSLI
ncbi:MAG: hypothetical protein V7K69_12565 [Nostoc sp.]|uniref:hypothetical protein n=1 Tax=Nostoc sp. TaxID=1180 RepID=UPI002FF4521C